MASLSDEHGEGCETVKNETEMKERMKTMKKRSSAIKVGDEESNVTNQKLAVPNETCFTQINRTKGVL